MSSKADIRNEAMRLQSFFEKNGAQLFEADILQPADILLDLYGEDIRARAFVTHDPLSGELMLRPDFTVPVVQKHMKDGAEPARYTYTGEVFRRQECMDTRSSEMLQVGYEVFDNGNPASADAEVFSLFSKVLKSYSLRAVTGDIAILRAAISGLNTTQRRKSALMRHIWRPKRFRYLLDRFGGETDVPETRQKMLANPNPLASLDQVSGLRTQLEIAERIESLRQDAMDPPISKMEIEMLDKVLGLKTNSINALARLQELSHGNAVFSRAVDGLDERLKALENQGVELKSLEFEASYGRSSMEYYDGFVFGFYADIRAETPPIATGGRYDALTSVLGQGRSIPAVGGVIRPELFDKVSQ